MKKVNLSRIHTMIRNEFSDLRALQLQLGQRGPTRTLRIFERTDEDDLNLFKQELHELRTEFYASVAELDKHERYIEYLKTVLDDANRKNGVTLLLLKENCLRNKLQRLEELKNLVRPQPDGITLDTIKPADYYKSAYTEDSRIFDLYVQVLDNRDYQKICREYEAARDEHRAMLDQIATINQSKFVNIQEFAEFH